MLSIIIPALNEAENLARLLPHLQAVCPQAEVIVVDGGSGDDTQEVVRRFPRVKYVVSEQGRATQMNAGARKARGEVLLFLHADTLLPPGAQMAVRKALTDPGVVYGRFNVRFDSHRPIFRIIAGMMDLRSRLSGIFTGDQAIFVRRAIFEALGGYPDIPLMEDVELTRRLKLVARRACLRLPVITSARKWERDGILRTILLMWRLRLFYYVGVKPARLHGWYYQRGPRTVGAPAPAMGAGDPASRRRSQA